VVANHPERVVLVEPSPTKRQVLAERLRSQGYLVDALASGAEAATAALALPPSALIADLRMPGVSGVQLCRLLKAELATEHVPVILRGPSDTPRQRFWADRAGASAYVVKGRVGELVRQLARAIADAPPSDGFFQIHPEEVDIRDRICAQLDAALYQSVLASEVRALSSCDTVARLFDVFTQFVCQVTTYRWLAIHLPAQGIFAVHAHPDASSVASDEARRVMQVPDDAEVVCVEDEDAAASDAMLPPLVRAIRFGGASCGNVSLGTVAMAPLVTSEEDGALLDLVSAEIGGPIRIVTLVEETRRLASSDPLTGLTNRRAFSLALETEIARAERLGHPLSMLLLDVDHFKSVNDTHGHQVGDAVLREVGKCLRGSVRVYDHVARWGGEEFVVALPQANAAEAAVVAERIRARIAGVVIPTVTAALSVTASVGIAARRAGEQLDGLIERADQAMYLAKTGGRNQVVTAPRGRSPSVSTPILRMALKGAAKTAVATPMGNDPRALLGD
jgi:two-component system cell cycle response regulator